MIAAVATLLFESGSDILDAEAVLVAAIERHDRLYRPYLKHTAGLMLVVDCDPLRGYIVVRLVDVGLHSEICNVHGETRLTGVEAEQAAMIIQASGAEWALEMAEVVQSVADYRMAVAS